MLDFSVHGVIFAERSAADAQEKQLIEVDHVRSSSRPRERGGVLQKMLFVMFLDPLLIFKNQKPMLLFLNTDLSENVAWDFYYQDLKDFPRLLCFAMSAGATSELWFHSLSNLRCLQNFLWTHYSAHLQVTKTGNFWQSTERYL